MKKWSELKQAILDELAMDESEAQDQNYFEKFQPLANKCINVIANGIMPQVKVFEIDNTEVNNIVTMPEDFLSFADMINYLNDEPDPTIVYYGYNMLKLPEIGKYQIFYNSYWKTISKDDVNNDTILPIPESILNCVPTYVAAQLLLSDDVQKSVILNNTFELMLSRLDNNVMYESNSFKSKGGWY